MEKKSLRMAYGEALVEFGKTNNDIVVLEADLGKSTMSCLFKDAYPERYFESKRPASTVCQINRR